MSSPVKPKPEPKILVAISGGVDSAVAAHLLKKRGFNLEAAYMKNWINEENVFGNCPWQEDIEDARRVCDHLKIPFRVLNFMQEYRDRIVNYLVQGYQHGITPNPDVMCNREMKFGVLLDWALENGFDAVATGHYCRREAHPEEPWLREGVDKNKDQSYFLAMMTPEQLAKAHFPVGDLTKPQVRKLAEDIKLPNAGKKDSQGICFIGEVKINDFLEKFIEDKPGPIRNLAGKTLGEHRGLHRYTLGQRRGIGVPSNADNEFYVVVDKEVETNTLVVGFESEHPDPLWHNEVRLQQLSWLTNSPPSKETRLYAKVRYRDPSVPVTFSPQQDGSAVVKFDDAQRGLASGQVCALYENDRLLGGGVYL